MPLNHCIFNLIELVWAQLKENIRKINKSSKFCESVTQLIIDVIKYITTNSWCTAIDHVRKIEAKYNDLPRIYPNLTINLNTNRDSTEPDLEDDADIFT